jgi:hypothetical protein
MNQSASLPVIQSLWIGDSLSVMEQLSIASFIQNDHPFHLYTYGPIDNVPQGAKIMDANAIIPKEQMEQHQSLAGFSDIFRYKLLYEKGNYWCDTDLICLKPFSSVNPYVFATEQHHHKGLRFWMKKKKYIASCVIKCPEKSAIMKYCYDTASRFAPADINREDNWGVIGPTLLQNAVRKFNLKRYASAPEIFCPVDFMEWKDLISKPHDPRTFREAKAVHLWNEFWRANAVDKGGTFISECTYEYLKKQYLNAHALVPDVAPNQTLRCSSC